MASSEEPLKCRWKEPFEVVEVQKIVYPHPNLLPLLSSMGTANGARWPTVGGRGDSDATIVHNRGKGDTGRARLEDGGVGH